MPLTQAEFEAILDDRTQRIDGDISWSEDDGHSPTRELRVEIRSANGYPLFIRGSYNALAKTLTSAMIHRGAGRIYALDLGNDHYNPKCEDVGRTHKHRWNERLGHKEAYVPHGVTATAWDVVAAWQQCCAEANIDHRGRMH